MGRSLAASSRTPTGGRARRLGVSGGLSPVGRVLEPIDQGFEQQDHQKVRQNECSGGTFIGAWRAFQSDDTFQSLEGEFHTPTQSIQGQGIASGKFLGAERSHDNDPLRGDQGLGGDRATAFLRRPTRPPPGRLGRLRRQTCRDQAQVQRFAAGAVKPAGLIDQPSRRGLERGDEVEQRAVPVEPTSVAPGGAHQYVRALGQYSGDPFRLNISGIRDAYLAPDDGNKVQLFAALLVGHLEMTEALAGKIESAVNTPDAVAAPFGSRGFRHRCRIDQADKPAFRGGRGTGGEDLAHQSLKPRIALSQAVQQTDIGDVGQTDRGGPDGCQAKTVLAQAIGQHEAQQNDRVADHTTTLKGFGFTRGDGEVGSTAELLDGGPPVCVEQGIGASHRIVESYSTPRCKRYFSAYGRRPTI